jgi:extracellular elastinolytic metalloproteinase
MQHVQRHRSSRRRTLAAGLTAALSLTLFLASIEPAGSVRRHSPRPLTVRRPTRTFDVRSRGTSAAIGTRTLRARATLARGLGSQAVISSDPVTGTLRMIGRLNGYLTGPSRRPATRVAMSFVRAHLPAFGLSKADLGTLRLRNDYVDIAGTHHMSWTQSARGITVFHNGLRATITRRGRLVNVMGSPVHALRPSSFSPRLSTDAAIRAARADGDATIDAPQQGDSASLTLFPTGRGTRLAWQTYTWPSTQQLNLSVVDAVTGAVLYRQSLTSDATGTATAWEFYPSDIVPAGANTANPVTFPVKDGTSLFGDNAWVYADVNDDNRANAGEEIPAASGTDWSRAALLNTTDGSQSCSTARPCTWDSHTPFSWQANMAQNGAQVMYYLNKFHDHLEAAPYGFTGAAGNFELAGGDPVIGNTLDGANTKHGLPDRNHFDNANMSTPPDGHPPLMQMYLFHGVNGFPIPSANGGDDAEVVYHEYTHGLSGRLVVYPDGTTGLTSWQAGAMGEGWSDWYAEDFLNNQGFKPDTSLIGDVVMGDITFAGFLRSQPVDCPVGGPASACPGGASTGSGGYTFGDLGQVSSVPDTHADGEVWLETLWQIRQTIGAATAEALVTRAMELSPPGPSMLDMRNAILQADLVNFAGADQDALWSVFAQRGMGYFAYSAPGAPRGNEDFSTPPDCSMTTCGSISGTVKDKTSGKPIAGATVAVPLLDTGLASDLSATTDQTGAFQIMNVPPHTYRVLHIAASGYESVALANVNVSGPRTMNFKLIRDWASTSGGARLTSFSKPDYSPVCGPDLAFDASLEAGWGSDAVGSDVGSNYTGPRKVTVKLAKVVDITSFAVASGGTCGDGPRAGVKKFRIETRGKNGAWVNLGTGSVAANGAYAVFTSKIGMKNVLYVRFTMLTNHGDPLFMDVLELSVRGK